MNIGHHAAHVSRSVRFARYRILFRFHIIDDGFVPQGTVSLIDRVDFALVRNSHINVGQDELANGRIVRESIDAVAEAQHNGCGRSVKCISGGDHVPAGLQSIADLRINARITLFAINGENAADRDEAFDVRRTVQRIEADNVFASFVGIDLDHAGVLLGHQQAGGVGRLQHIDEQFVGQHVQLLDFFALHVGVA